MVKLSLLISVLAILFIVAFVKYMLLRSEYENYEEYIQNCMEYERKQREKEEEDRQRKTGEHAEKLGEKLFEPYLEKLDGFAQCRFMKNANIPYKDYFQEIDVLAISENGCVFCVEAKDISGYIEPYPSIQYQHAGQFAEYVQIRNKNGGVKEEKKQSPLYQNRTHILALQKFLLDKGYFTQNQIEQLTFYNIVLYGLWDEGKVSLKEASQSNRFGTIKYGSFCFGGFLSLNQTIKNIMVGQAENNVITYSKIDDIFNKINQYMPLNEDEKRERINERNAMIHISRKKYSDLNDKCTWKHINDYYFGISYDKPFFRFDGNTLSYLLIDQTYKWICYTGEYAFLNDMKHLYIDNKIYPIIQGQFRYDDNDFFIEKLIRDFIDCNIPYNPYEQELHMEGKDVKSIVGGNLRFDYFMSDFYLRKQYSLEDLASPDKMQEYIIYKNEIMNS